MARGRARGPWPVIVAAALAILVAGGALVGANVVREQRDTAPSSSPVPSPSTSVGVRGCMIEPCRVLATAPVAGTSVELVADNGAQSGRLRIGGPSSSEVIEVTVTDLGVTLTETSLQCVAGALSVCLVSGVYEDGTAGQVVVGRSGKWNTLSKPYVSGAGDLSIAEVTATQTGPEIIAAQYECDRATVAECADRPVFAQVFAVSTGVEVGCTGTYSTLESLPGYPDVALTGDELSSC